MTILPGDDKNLIRKLISGDVKSFEKIYNRYEKRLYYYILKLTKEELIAEELLQDVFLKIWDNRKTINPDLNFQAYIYKIANNKSLDYLRSKARREKLNKTFSQLATTSTNETEIAIIFAQYESLLKDFIQKLSPEKQAIYQMSQQQGKSSEEIAQKLNISPKTVRNNQYHILKILKMKLLPHLDIGLPLLFIFFNF